MSFLCLVIYYYYYWLLSVLLSVIIFSVVYNINCVCYAMTLDFDSLLSSQLLHRSSALRERGKFWRNKNSIYSWNTDNAHIFTPRKYFSFEREDIYFPKAVAFRGGAVLYSVRTEKSGFKRMSSWCSLKNIMQRCFLSSVYTAFLYLSPTISMIFNVWRNDHAKASPPSCRWFHVCRNSRNFPPNNQHSLSFPFDDAYFPLLN